MTLTPSDRLNEAQTLLVTLDLPPIHPVPEMKPHRDMRIQRARPDALDDIRDLLSRLDLPHSDLTPSHLEHFLVCHEDGDIVGVVGLELYDNVALLRSLAVRPTHRNRGIGARLTEKIEHYGRRNGVNELYLLTTTASDYFDRQRYETIDRDDLPSAIRETEEATQLCPASATCMRKDLTG